MDERDPQADDGAKLFGLGQHAPVVPSGGEAAHAGPSVGLITTSTSSYGMPEASAAAVRSVRVCLVARDHEPLCDFWIGLTKPGTASPGKLLDIPSTPALLLEAAAHGIDDPGPLMLSDTNRSPARHVYLLPRPEAAFREQSIWIQDLVKTLRSWAPPRVGIYFAPELVPGPAVHALLQDVLRQAVEATSTNEFHLFTGTYGLNAVLNAALRTKADLDTPQLHLQIFH